MSGEEIETADRLTFWRNWYTAARQLPDDLSTGESIAAASIKGIKL